MSTSWRSWRHNPHLRRRITAIYSAHSQGSQICCLCSSLKEWTCHNWTAAFLIVTTRKWSFLFVTLFHWVIHSVHRGRPNRTEVISAKCVVNRLGSVSLLNRMGKEFIPSDAFISCNEHMYCLRRIRRSEFQSHDLFFPVISTHSHHTRTRPIQCR